LEPDKQILIFGGKQLEDRMLLSHYNITGGSTVSVTSRLPGSNFFNAIRFNEDSITRIPVQDLGIKKVFTVRVTRRHDRPINQQMDRLQQHLINDLVVKIDDKVHVVWEANAKSYLGFLDDEKWGYFPVTHAQRTR
jgi:hypothetical protein